MAPIKVTYTQMSDARRLISRGVVQAVLVDSKESVSGRLQDVLERCVQENLLQCEKWTRTFLQDLLASNTAAADIRALNDHMADYLTQSFRQRHASLTSGPVDLGRPYEPHINVLRRMNYDLSRHLRLEGTMLLDRLYECDMLSETERLSILAKATDKRKNEAFVEFLCSNFTTEKFKASILPLLSEEQVHADLAERIIAELEASSTNSDTIRCTFCKMKALVSPRKLSEVLFQQGSISPSLKHDLCLSTQPNSSKWEQLLKHVQKEKKLLDALEKSHGHLFREFQETGHSVLRCCCFTMTSNVSEISDFASEVLQVRPQIRQSSGPLQENLEQVNPHSDYRYTLEIAKLLGNSGRVGTLAGNVSSQHGSRMKMEKKQTYHGSEEDETQNSFLQIHTDIKQEMKKYKANVGRPGLEYVVNEHILANETNLPEVQEVPKKMARTNRMVTERKQVIEHVEMYRKATEENMAKFEREQEVVDFSKVDRKLRSVKKELEKIQKAYVEKRTSL